MKTVAVLLFCVAAVGLRAAEPPLLRLTTIIPLPGLSGRFDHFAMDPKGPRLFVAALGNNTLEVLDLAVPQRGSQDAEIRIYQPE